MTKQEFIIQPEKLREQLKDPDIVIIDCRFRLGQKEWGLQEYLKNHIPGSYYLDLEKDLSSPVKKHGGRHPLPNIEQLAQKLSSLGIEKNKTLIITYDDSRLAFSARLWWLLRYLGHEPVQILDGGWTAWNSLGYPISNQVTPTKKHSLFIPQPRQDYLVDLEQVKALNSNKIVLIDSREEKRYRGEEEPIDPIAGHIPGAINSPYLWVSDSQGYLQPEQHNLWLPYLNTDQSLWVYCGSGVTACVNLFSLEQVGLFNQAKLYLGGWSDWCSHLTSD